ncbi:hypothetical protein [uncultured Desulfosarcina sp.]|uniref:hypothetical protein n=1 Tax=uncultured Desulfosarcina sp. TaxID=218289 RepID=UPI0029C8C80A|nr:hypothetical protein [uncultured Desulfosarcina sp.]
MKKKLSLKRDQNKAIDYNQILLNLVQYKNALIDFVNEEDPKKARDSIMNSLQEWFNLETPTLSVILYYQKQLRELFDELKDVNNLMDSNKIHDFTIDYIPIRSEAVIDVQEDGTLGESSIHLMNRPFGDIITHCVIKLFSDGRNVKLINRCENEKCGKYFFAKKAKKKGTGGIRFCSDKCRFNFHSHRRIKSGEAKKYKKERYWEGKDQ